MKKKVIVLDRDLNEMIQENSDRAWEEAQKEREEEEKRIQEDQKREDV